MCAISHIRLCGYPSVQEDLLGWQLGVALPDSLLILQAALGAHIIGNAGVYWGVKDIKAMSLGIQLKQEKNEDKTKLKQGAEDMYYMQVCTWAIHLC